VGRSKAGANMMGAAAGIFKQSVCALHAKRENPGVFNDRFARSRALLHFTACRVLGNPERAELVVRNCWLRASRNPPRFSQEGAFRSWLLRLLIDEALAILHRPGSQQCAAPTVMNTSSWESPSLQKSKGEME
jgi:DNA-directed RNA polymerase specialized sigma24 family protein